MDKIKKFFADPKNLVMNFYINMFMLVVVNCILPIIINKKFELTRTLFITLLFISIYAGLFMSYKKHESNIQKSLISALFVMCIVNHIYEMNDYVNAIIFILLYIVHLLLMSDKKGTQWIIKAFYILIVFGLIYEIMHAIITKSLPGLLTSIPTIFFLVNIDTKIFMYKEIRAKCISEGTWTEENKNKAKQLFDI